MQHSVQIQKNQTALTVEDLPREMIVEILKKLAPASRIVTRNVSMPFRQLLDSTKPVIKSVGIKMEIDSITLIFDSESIKFTETTTGTSIQIGNCQIERSESFEILASQKLIEVVKHMKLEFEEFYVEMAENANKSKSANFFGCMCPFVFDVKKLTIKSAKNEFLLSPLAWMNSQTLETFEIAVTNRAFFFHEDDIFTFEQFTNAKTINLKDMGALFSFDLPRFYESQQFEITLASSFIDDFLEFQSAIILSSKFSKCTLHMQCPYSLPDMIATLLLRTRQDGKYVYRIPESDKYLEYTLTPECIIIEKMIIEFSSDV